MPAIVNATAQLLRVLAVALPFLFAWTQPPLSNFWPLMAAGACAWMLAAVAVWRLDREGQADLGVVLGIGVLLAAVVGAGVSLVQFFGGDVGWAPWIYPSRPGEALGNLRQRNQQATLVAMGFWALLWLVGQMQAFLAGRHSPVWSPWARHGTREWPFALLGLLLPWALVVLAASAAATASRTGALEWGVILVLVLWWRRSLGGLPLVLAGVGVLLYGLAAWWLPDLLLQWTGVRMDGLFDRVQDGSFNCNSRSTLWPNMAYLVTQRPWTGWGWGELDYAHYATLFPGERFCVLVDNAHNLPLHLAVELGLPVAIGGCALVLWGVVRSRPWAERDPLRQLAWGLLAVVGVHSLLEFPLWYGPFQLATVLALVVLWRPRWPAQAPRALLQVGCAAVLAVAVIGAGWLVHDYQRVSGLYRAASQRAPQYRSDTGEQVARENRFFRTQAEFAWVTTTRVTAANAAQVYPVAQRLLHYSPEPRVIESVLASAALLGLQEEVAFHTERYRIAYPQDYARWVRAAAPRPSLAGPGPSASAQNVATSAM